MSDLPLTRQSLLIALGKRSDEAWSEFLRVYEKAIIGYCIRRGLQESDAQDVAQSVYEAIHKRMAEWDCDASKGSFRAWLFRVARNISVDLLTARAKSPVVQGDTSIVQMLGQVRDYRNVDLPGTVDEHSTAFQLELRRALFEWASNQVQAEVTAKTWEAFRLAAVDGLQASEVANKLEISVGSVYTAKCRVMSRIREHVDSWDDELDSLS